MKPNVYPSKGCFRGSLIALALSMALTTGVSAQSALENLASIKHDVKSRRISSYDRSGGNGDNVSDIGPGETYTLCDIKGSGVINHIWITMSPPAPELSRSDVIFRIYWDGNDYPSVESPIGPLFGQGWDETYTFTSLPITASPVNGNAMSCYFQMPFSKGAKIVIENQADRKINHLYFYVDYLEMKQAPEDPAYFHAWYNHQVTEAHPEEGENEWNLLSSYQGKNPLGERNYLVMKTEGKGHYAGVNYYVNCPTPIWYGEGDDMFFIDGEEFPSIHGTGTEDYFNSSWCPNEILYHPYFGYGRVPDKLQWLGRTHAYRFHITDPVYFDKSLKFTIEHGDDNYLTLELSSVAYWYQDKPSKIDPIPDKESRKLMPEINELDIHRWRNEYRKNFGEEKNPWGNERIEEKEK